MLCASTRRAVCGAVHPISLRVSSGPLMASAVPDALVSSLQLSCPSLDPHGASGPPLPVGPLPRQEVCNTNAQWPASLRQGDCTALGNPDPIPDPIPQQGFSGLLILIKGCILIYANVGRVVVGSHRHPSPHFPAPIIHQPGLKDKYTFCLRQLLNLDKLLC